MIDYTGYIAALEMIDYTGDITALQPYEKATLSRTHRYRGVALHQ